VVHAPGTYQNQQHQTTTANPPSTIVVYHQLIHTVNPVFLVKLLITIETDWVREAPYIIGPTGGANVPGETFWEVQTRLALQGPNDMPALLALNQWVTDNNYDVYSTRLRPGEGIRYYKETPVNVAPKTVIDPQIVDTYGAPDPYGQGGPVR
jgi:hypothetical protein